ncbi:DUF4845 domain-containing protein [Pseudorhodoferax sp. Leaf265]|uniref:DUF4845 domain-containing protein n=1 Tax=Pseudorhodoferax sp. Leaf265 TaxID=1736315 RepID=UPI000701AB3B|nr:DUF4845 domain-containing protein [Pseudorhodoferax sp. Leaf265]KQP03038.1 hypothetical protein ASF45_17535 [Pseudorhodoferax sp. Leaf265]
MGTLSQHRRLGGRQTGLSFFGVVILGAIVVFCFVVGAKIVPTVVEYQAIRKAADRAAAGTTVAEVRSLFDRSAAVDDISSIKGTDLAVSKEGEKVVVSFAYNKEIELFGPAYLLLKYQGRSR